MFRPITAHTEAKGFQKFKEDRNEIQLGQLQTIKLENPRK